MKHFCWQLVLLFGLLQIVEAQSSSTYREVHSRNSFFFEAYGKAISWSANLEKRFLVSESTQWGIQIGINDRSTVPLSLTMIRGKHPLQLEGGVGILFQFYHDLTDGQIIYDKWVASEKVGYTGHLGLRYQPKKGGLLLRLMYTPVWGEFRLPGEYAIERHNLHRIGISVGVAIKRGILQSKKGPPICIKNASYSS
ncbi:hypothetical protein [Pontibacter sp. G13]|uniref:hypothetical protein n=1 Tax=Pontibacter sp. G13 TaxID=3074898 RepID=UPI00288B07CC|nr:hypothetical protein [Pontibacter sp. G13]WNJ19599.1 hypothetical protein RJD25_03850 [Pontibacter sp. G13]